MKNQKITFPGTPKAIEAPGANNNQIIVNGVLSNGIEYFIAENKNAFWVYGWISGQWKRMSLENVATTAVDDLTLSGPARCALAARS